MGESDDELRQISEQLDHLTHEIDILRKRLGQLETAPGKPSGGGPSADPVPFGVTAVNRAGAITLVVGIIYFFKYAVDNQWIGAAGRLLMGLIAGLALIAAAAWLRKRDQQMFSQGIAGCGLATLYITCYAAFSWYRYLPLPAAATALVAVSALAVMLSLYFGQQTVAALGFTGAVLTPILLREGHQFSGITLVFLVLIDTTGVLLVSKWGWTLLVPLMGAESTIAAFLLTPATHPDWFTVFAFTLAAVHFGAAFRTSASHASDRAIFATGHGLIVLGMLRQLNLWTQRLVSESERTGAQSEFGSVFLAGYGIAAIAYGVMRNSTFARTMGLVMIGVVIAKLYLWDVWFLERLYRTSAFVALGILLLAASWVYSRARDSR